MEVVERGVSGGMVGLLLGVMIAGKRVRHMNTSAVITLVDAVIAMNATLHHI